MNTLKICAQIILICLLLGFPNVANAELQGKLFGDNVVTEDGESFNVGELIKALDDGNIDAAESIYNDCVKRREQMLKRGTQFGIFDCYLKHCYATILYLKTDYKASIAVEDEVLDYLRDHLNEWDENDPNLLNTVYNSLRFKRFSYDKLKEYETILVIQKDIVNLLESKFPLEQSSVLKEKMNLSSCYYNVHDYKTAIKICEELLLPFEKVFGEKSAELRDLRRRLAEDYNRDARFTDEVKLYEEILKSDIEVYGETDEKTLESYYNLIDMYYAFKYYENYEKMGIWLNKLVPVVENLPDSYLKYGILEKQADYYGYTRQFQKSLELFERLLNMPISNNTKIRVLIHMADCYRVLADYSNALKYIGQAWDIYEKYLSYDEYSRSDILRYTSLIYSAIGNHQEALCYAQEAYDFIVELNGIESYNVLIMRDTLADCYENMGQYYKALELYKENYELAIKLNGNDTPLYDTPLHIEPMRNIAWTYYQLGDYKSGITWAKKAVDDSIMIWGEKSFATIYSQRVLARLYEKDENTLDEAIKIQEKILETYKEILSEQDPGIDVSMLNLAATYHVSARWKEAIPLYEKVIERRENRAETYGSLTADEKRNIFAKQSLAYVAAAMLYYRDNNFKDAFKTFERGKSRLLIDSYSEQIAKTSGILEEKEIIKLNEYKTGLADYAKQIDESFKAGDEQARFKLESEQRILSDEYVKYKDSLQNIYPKYKTFSQANKLDIERDKNILPANTAFVDYMVVNNWIIAFVFDNSGDVKAVRFKMPKNFFEKCTVYHELLGYPNLEVMQKANRFLWKNSNDDYKIIQGMNKPAGYERVKDDESFNAVKQNLSKYIGDVLLAPLAEHISKYQNLIIAPDKDLNTIPFETLEFNGKPAIETFNMSYVPSFSVLKLMYEAGEKNSKLTNRQDLYAMGNAFYGNNDETAAQRSLENFIRGQRGEIAVNQFRNLEWANLPGSEKEINRVSEIFKNPKIFTEKSASESNLKASNKRDELSKYKYFLFSTHGLFDPYAPEYSSIVLSQGVDKNEDGYVTIGEWAGMDLNSDVVFLSACETGLGEYQAGEGIVGIPYALTIAGNKNTVMSLWKVYDAYTPEFVSTFFKKMKEGKSAFIAINETKREFLKNPDAMYRDPAVWSAFVLYGF